MQPNGRQRQVRGRYGSRARQPDGFFRLRRPIPGTTLGARAAGPHPRRQAPLPGMRASGPRSRRTASPPGATAAARRFPALPAACASVAGPGPWLRDRPPPSARSGWSRPRCCRRDARRARRWARCEYSIPADELQLRAVNLRRVLNRLNRRSSVNPSWHKRVELLVGVGRVMAPPGHDVEFLSRRINRIEPLGGASGGATVHQGVAEQENDGHKLRRPPSGFRSERPTLRPRLLPLRRLAYA